MPRRRWSGCTAPEDLGAVEVLEQVERQRGVPDQPTRRRAPARTRRPAPHRRGRDTPAGTSRPCGGAAVRPSSAALSIAASSRGQGEVEVGDRRSASSSTVTRPPGAGRPGRGCRGSPRGTPRAGAPRSRGPPRPRGSSGVVLGQPAGVAGSEAGLERVPLVQVGLVRGHHPEAVRLGELDQRARGRRTRRRARPAVRWPPASGATTRCPRRRPAVRRVGAGPAARSGRRRSRAAGPPRPPGPRSGRRRCR